MWIREQNSTEWSIRFDHRVDTSAERVLLELLRKAPPWRKLELMDQLNQSLRMLVMNELRRQHPEKSESELRYLLAKRLYGSETAAQLSEHLLDSH